MQTIAVLGLGRMGHGIASRLLDCGHKVLVWNRSPAKAVALIEKGAVWVDMPSEAAMQAGIIFSMLADDKASATVWLGADGALHHMAKGSFLIECSTLSASHVTKLAAAAKAKELVYIDCPVTGLPEAAAAGRLTLLVGADTAALETVTPVLESLSVAIRYFGPVGSGTAYKLIINLMGAVQIAALAEGLALADKLSLDRETVIKAIENSAAASPNVVRHARVMAERNFAEAPSFTTALRYKDAAYALSLAKAAGSPVALGKAAALLFKKAGKAAPDADEATVIKTMM